MYEVQSILLKKLFYAPTISYDKYDMQKRIRLMYSVQ